MSRRKLIDRSQVRELFESGLGVVEIAERIGCTKGAVSKALKQMDVEVTKAALPNAPKYVGQQDAIRTHLLFLAEKAKGELEWIENSVLPATDGEYRAWQDQKLKFAAEMRKLISTVVDIGYKFFQQSEVMQILQEIDAEVGRESKECQKRIRERLRTRRNIRFPLELD